MKQVIEKWCQALESGEFKQGKNSLCNEVEDSYCCLGVLCKINNVDAEVILAHNVLNKTHPALFSLQVAAELKNGYGDPVNYDLVREKLLSIGVGVVGFTTLSLVNLNDKGVTFNNIAALLRSGAYSVVDNVGTEPLESE